MFNYHCKQSRGAGGKFMLMFPEMKLITVATAHNQRVGIMLQTLPGMLITAFVTQSRARINPKLNCCKK
jgi:hypothetical protein